MNGNELLRRLRGLGRRKGVPVRWRGERGKGSHGTLYWGERLAVIPDLKAELKSGTLHAVLKQLGLSLKDME